MVRRQRSDANQTEIAKRYREHGCSVLILSQDNSVDMLVGCRGHDALIEVKDGKKPPSARKLTEKEQQFHESWRGTPIRIVESVEDVDTHVEELQNKAFSTGRWALDHCS